MVYVGKYSIHGAYEIVLSKKNLSHTCWGFEVARSQMGEEYLVGSGHPLLGTDISPTSRHFWRLCSFSHLVGYVSFRETFLRSCIKFSFFLNMSSWPFLAFTFHDDILRKRIAFKYFLCTMEDSRSHVTQPWEKHWTSLGTCLGRQKDWSWNHPTEDEHIELDNFCNGNVI